MSWQDCFLIMTALFVLLLTGCLVLWYAVIRSSDGDPLAESVADELRGQLATEKAVVAKIRKDAEQAEADAEKADLLTLKAVADLERAEAEIVRLKAVNANLTAERDAHGAAAEDAKAERDKILRQFLDYQRRVSETSESLLVITETAHGAVTNG